VNAQSIIEVFNNLFSETHDTILVGGASEPLYRALPRAEIQFRQDYVSSALHEVAHWCIAGHRRRHKNDFGYWYLAERSLSEQREFEDLESKPQALEWIFSVAAGVPFRVSVDNFEVDNRQYLQKKVWQRTAARLKSGLPARAQIFAKGLSRASGITDYLNCDYYKDFPL